MKLRAGIFIFAIAILSVASSAMAADESPFDNAVAVWHMADLSDSAGKNSQLTTNGKVNVGIELKGEERAVSLSRGGDGQVTWFNGGWLSAGQGVEGELDLTDEAMTLCLRVRDPSGRWTAGLFSKKAGAVMNYNLFAWNLGGTMDFGFELGIAGQPSFKQLRTPVRPLVTTDWHDLVVRCDGAKLQLFVDGILRQQQSVAEPMPEAKDGLCLIGADPGGQNTFSGMVDHAALWNRALTDVEIEYLSGGVDAIKKRKTIEYAVREEIQLAREEEQRKSNEELEKARRRIAKDPYYPKFHVAPPVGWMNDPHPIYFKGAYHIFYQYSYILDNPYGGPHCWGHAASQDLIHWRHYPPAVTPKLHGIAKDRHIYSGCLVDNNGVGTAIYTVENIDVWSAASTDADLATFKKHPGNPVIRGPPPGLPISGGMRDPWVWKEEDGWYMIIGSGLKDQKGPVLPLYKSTDLVHWEYLHPFYQGDPEKDSPFCECPSFFPLGDKHVLAISHQATYLVGRYEDHRFTPEHRGRLDYGGIYVPQFVLDDKGRRIMWGWVGGWEADPRSREAQIRSGWSGMQTIPRVVSLGSDGLLRFRPAEELRELRKDHRQFQNVVIGPDSAGILEGSQGSQQEIQAIIATGSAQTAGLQLRVDSQRIEILFDVAAKTLRCKQRTAPLTLAPDEPLRLRIFLDGFSVEVYANERVCITEQFYTSSPDRVTAELFARGGTATARKVDVWKMGSHWKEREEH